MWLLNFVEVKEELNDLLAGLNDGDIISKDELDYVMRHQTKWELTDINIIADSVGMRLKHIDENNLQIIDQWKVSA